MAESHMDREHPNAKEWFERLERKASEIRALGQSTIAGGRAGEETIASWNAFGVGVIQRPPDEHGVLRISIGGGNTPLPLNYLTFRGPRDACIDLLRRALQALEAGEDVN